MEEVRQVIFTQAVVEEAQFAVEEAQAVVEEAQDAVEEAQAVVEEAQVAVEKAQAVVEEAQVAGKEVQTKTEGHVFACAPHWLWRPPSAEVSRCGTSLRYRCTRADLP